MEMNKILGRSILVSAFVLILLSCQKSSQREAPNDENKIAAPVKVFAVKRGFISEQLHKTGLIQAWKEIKITPSIGGQVHKIHVQEGEMVKKGQLLAELDTRAFKLQLEQAQAGLTVAEANYRDAKRNMERMDRLNRERAVSEQQYERVKLLYDAAEAQVQQAEAILNLARHNVEESMMKAPFHGVVASKNADEGDVINPMMVGFIPNAGVLTLMDYSRIKISVEVSERDVLRIEKGQLALVNVDAYPEETFPGRVSLVNLTADPASKKFSVEIDLENSQLKLKPNTFGEVTFVVEKRDEALVIPLEAILEAGLGTVTADNVCLTTTTTTAAATTTTTTAAPTTTTTTAAPTTTTTTAAPTTTTTTTAAATTTTTTTGA